MNPSHWILIVLWIFYYTLHSVLAASSVKSFFKKKLGRYFRYYRLAYTIFAFITLLLLLAFQYSFLSPILIQSLFIKYIAVVFLIIPGFVVMGISIKKYFMLLSGIRSVFTPTPPTELKINGIHRFVRHPLYAGTILFVWGLFFVFPMLNNLIAVLLLILYVLAGIIFEEKKLIKEFGESYRLYISKVPMLIPSFWKERFYQKLKQKYLWKMKYQPGDTVLLLHSQEEGEVVEIMNDKMILVDVNGVRFPVYLDQVDFPYFKRFTEKKIVVPQKEKVYIDNLKKEKTTNKYHVHSGVWLSFLPVFDKDIFEDAVVEKFKMYLLNQTGEIYNFSYTVRFKGSPDFHLNNTALPFNEFYLHDIPFEEMNDAPKFEFDFSLQKKNKNKQDNYEVSVKIKAKQLFQKIEEMRMRNEPTFSFNLFENFPDKADEVIPDYQNSGGRLYNISQIKEKLEPARSVVDLHIEKLTDNWKSLSNFEILTIQLNNFEKFYQLAVAHHQPNLIIIHGVGTGKLRNEIHEILKTKKEVRTFANQYHENFGFGATEIFFEY